MKKTELYIENHLIELYPDESFVITKQNNGTDIITKAAGYGKDINIPSTPNNDKFFAFIFNINAESGFNPTSRKSCILFQDSLPIIQGYFQLLSISEVDGYRTYQGTIYEEQINFVNALDEFYVDNLVMPVTGTTTILSEPFTAATTFELNGLTTYRQTEFSSIVIGSGLDWHDSLQYIGITFNVGSGYGTIQQVAHSEDLSWFNTQWTDTIGAYVATINQKMEWEVNLNMSTFLPAYSIYKYRFIKTTLSGNDVVIGEADLNFNSTTHTLQTNQTVFLLAGEKVRFELENMYWGADITLEAGSEITGTIYLPTETIVTGYTINSTTIFDNINNVENADDGLFVFPLIDYNDVYTFDTLNLGNVINNNFNTNLVLNVEDFRPALFAKHIWDAIFEQSGFKYESDFINSDLFKKIIIVGGTNAEEQEALLYHTVANYSGTTDGYNITISDDQTYFSTSGLVDYYYYGYNFTLTSDGGIDMGNINLESGSSNKPFKSIIKTDEYITEIPSYKFSVGDIHTISGNNYYGFDLTVALDDDDRRGAFATAATDGDYRVDCKIKFDAKVPRTTTQTLSSIASRISLILLKLPIGSYKYYPNSNTAPSFEDWEEIQRTEVVRVANGSVQTFDLSINEKIALKKGDMVRAILVATTGAQTIRQEIHLDTTASETYFKFSKIGTFYNGTITNAVTLLPKNFKQKDFILEMAKLFNLYFEADTKDKKLLYVEPRPDYYAVGKIQNWENKLDYSKEILSTVLSHEEAKNFIFKYKDDDKDYWSTKYKDLVTNKLIFGSYKYTSPNEYVTTDETLESAFAPSYLQEINNSGVKITKIHDPQIYEDNWEGGDFDFDVEPRVMFYKKMAAPTNNYLMYVSVTPYDFDFQAINSVVPSVYTQPLNVNLMSYYGYAGHLDDPDNPTYDLNWYTDFNYLPNTTSTTNNLVKTYYKNQLIELTDQTARRLTAYFKLTPADIVNLKFNDSYFFLNSYWKLIEVTDYNTSADVTQTTRCTFLKTLENETYNIINYASSGFVGVTGGNAGGLLTKKTTT